MCAAARSPKTSQLTLSRARPTTPRCHAFRLRDATCAAKLVQDVSQAYQHLDHRPDSLHIHWHSYGTSTCRRNNSTSHNSCRHSGPEPLQKACSDVRHIMMKPDLYQGHRPTCSNHLTLYHFTTYQGATEPCPTTIPPVFPEFVCMQLRHACVAPLH